MLIEPRGNAPTRPVKMETDDFETPEIPSLSTDGTKYLSAGKPEQLGMAGVPVDLDPSTISIPFRQEQNPPGASGRSEALEAGEGNLNRSLNARIGFCAIDLALNGGRRILAHPSCPYRAIAFRLRIF